MFSLEKRRLRGSQLLSSATNTEISKKTESGFSQNAQQDGRSQWSQVEAKEIANKCKKNTFPARAVKHWDAQKAAKSPSSEIQNLGKGSKQSDVTLK